MTGSEALLLGLGVVAVLCAAMGLSLWAYSLMLKDAERYQQQTPWTDVVERHRGGGRARLLADRANENNPAGWLGARAEHE